MRDSLESAVSAGFSDFLSTSLLGDSIHDVNGSDPTAYPGTLPGTEYNHLSMLCGMTQSTVHNIFARPNNSPTISTIKKICDGLDITLGEFFQTEYFDTLEQELQ